jgi:predicted Zn-dependent protease
MPNSPAGLTMEGDLLAGEKNWLGAASVYRKALALEAAPMTVAKLHEVLKQAGKPQEAESALREALRTSPNDPTLRGFAGEQAIAASQWKLAAEHYEVVLRVNPGNVAAMNNLARSLNEIKDPRALAVAEDAYARAPQSPAVVDTLGMILLAKGETDKAVKLLKRAAEMAPKAADIRMHYAQSLIKAGDKTAAKTELNAIVKDLPDAPQLSAVRDLAARL